MAINTSILKSYAPQARREFIAAVKTRAARFGIVDGGSATIQEQGEVAIINGQAYPRTVARQCRDLQGKIRLRGFDAVMEEVAYTWFNRFAAIRYMELHGYLDHGFRVLSHPAGETTPEIVQHAEKVDLPGLKADRVVELKLDGRKDEELFRILLVAQCNALHAAMPFLFERIDDETELLLPDNLLHSDSVIRQMVAGVPEGDWQAIEIIGWLYQFYISEKKDQVIGTVVKSEDIPAATQLFTPNWIVKYMVQNSLGAKWLATYPDSPIRTTMSYYVEPADQEADVQHQLEAETPKSLEPEKLTFLDPASGSGHILVEAYDLLKEIYLERGYRLRDIPRLILQKNLFGLDIDDRAAQLSGFALMMRARADDRGILSGTEPVRLNVVAMQESRDIDGQTTSGLAEALSLDPRGLTALLDTFQYAKTYGSLTKVPAALAKAVLDIDVAHLADGPNDLVDQANYGQGGEHLVGLIRQAQILSRKYDVVAANPPYMGSKGMNGRLKEFAEKFYVDSKADLYAMFMEAAIAMTTKGGAVAMINMQSWMYLASYQRLRLKLLSSGILSSMLHLGERAFDTIGGAVVSTTAFIVRNGACPEYVGTFVRVVDPQTEKDKAAAARDGISKPSVPWVFRAAALDFQRMPGCPIAYDASPAVVAAFEGGLISEQFVSDGYLKTGNNSKYIRFHWEVSAVERSSTGPWRDHPKGGDFRRWAGNKECIVRWTADAIQHYRTDRIARILDERYWDLEGISWSTVTTGLPSFRKLSADDIANNAALCIFPRQQRDLLTVLGYLNSRAAQLFLTFRTQTINYLAGDVLGIPMAPDVEPAHRHLVLRCISISEADWNEAETSWDFSEQPLLSKPIKSTSVEVSYELLRQRWREVTAELQSLEEENNRLFVDAYGLRGELDTQVPMKEVTLSCNPAYRYGADEVTDEHEKQLRKETIYDLISYAVGCVFGRFSLSSAGVILGGQGETLDDYREKVPSSNFDPDADNIIPMLDDSWFEDDISDRFLDFLRVSFGRDQFDENLAFVENAIGKDIRKFFKRDFFSDHLKRYKRRPIYWVFSSGKEKAFEAIVYMHRYNETTLARMRMNYVVPLQSQMANRIERLATELSGANLSSAERKRKDTQRAKLIKQLEELGRFEEELRHLADQRIRIDLDDGVKVNYGKFGNLLAEVKAVTGGADD